jgi:hypothetical protein
MTKGNEMAQGQGSAIPAGRVFRKDKYFAETGYIPHPGQSLVHYDNTRHRVLCNGRRWGKSLFGGKEIESTAFVKNFLNQPMRGWIIGPNYTDAEKEFRVIYNTFKALGIDTISNKFVSNVDNGNMKIETNWGWVIECRSAQHPDSLVGEGLDFVLLAEAGRHLKRTFTEYVRPALSDKRGFSLMSGVPEDVSETNLLYWGYHRGQDANFSQWKSFQLPSWTNTSVFPGGRNDPEIVEAAADLTTDEFNRQYGGQFVLKRGRVMKEWDDDMHVRKLLYRRDLPLFAAVDFGYRNAWVWLWIQYDRIENRTYVIGEERFFERDTEDIAREMAGDPLISNLRAIYVDPSSPDDAKILTRHLGVGTRSNTGGEINPRMRMIRRALKSKPEHLPDDHPERQPGLVVDESCTDLIWEMREGYRWPESRGDGKNSSEIPMDDNNHGPEALSRYFKGHLESMNSAQGTGSRQSSIGMRKRAA